MADLNGGTAKGHGADGTPTSRTLALDLTDLLPGSDERCADRLTRGLVGDGIIEQAHVIDGDTTKPRLCVHYDAAAMSPTEVQRRALQAADTIASKYGHLRWLTTDTQDDEATRAALVDTLSAMPGVVSAAATPDSIELEFERMTVTAQELVDVIAAQVAPHRRAVDDEAAVAHDGDDADHQHGHGGIFGERPRLLILP